MKKLSYYLVLDQDYGNPEKRKKLDRVESIITEQLSNVLTRVSSPEKADIIHVGWWDWLMMETMRKFKDLDAIFFGLNAGTKGFLMNQINENLTIPTTLNQFEIIKIPVIPVSITLQNLQKKTWFYINDALLGWHVADFFTFEIETESKHLTIPWSWLVVNTPTWSTWYAANLKQPILDLASEMTWIAWIGTQWFDYGYFSPQEITISDSRWRDKRDLILDGKSWMIINDIKDITIYPPKQTVSLAFSKGQNFQDRRVLLAQEANWNTIQ